MVIQVFSGEAADLEYLFANDTARILVGNPDQIAGLISCSPFSRRFTSIVLSFNEKLADGPVTDDAKGVLNLSRLLEIVNGVRQNIAPEGQSERLAILAVIHTDKGRTEVHILIINVDLATGRQYSPYVHYRDAARLRNYQGYINVHYGLTDPDDIERQLNAMPNPRKGHFALISQITKTVQTHFKETAQVTVDDVADYLEHCGFRVRRTNSAGKKARLAVVMEEGSAVRLPGVWFRPDFDLMKFRSRKRKSREELLEALMRRLKRFKALTAKSHHRKPIDSPMDRFPPKIQIPIKTGFFARFVSVERWKHRKIPILAESLFSGIKRRSEWVRQLSDQLKFPILDMRRFVQGASSLTAMSIAKKAPRVPDPEDPEKAKKTKKPIVIEGMDIQ